MAEGRESVVVAVRSKQLLATSFHPELTEDSRWCFSDPCVILGARSAERSCWIA